MSELLANEVSRLEFAVLQPNDTVHVTTGLDSEAWNYDFNVEDNANSWPSGRLQETNPQGELSEVIPFELHGCGRWTRRRQNPVQTQEHAFTPYYEGLIVGSFLWGRVLGDTERLIFDQPGQAISRIKFVPYTENKILEVLSSNDDPLSVREIVEAMPADNAAKLSPHEVRKILAKLVVGEQVALLQKKTQVYQVIR